MLSRHGSKEFDGISHRWQDGGQGTSADSVKRLWGVHVMAKSKDDLGLLGEMQIYF